MRRALEREVGEVVHLGPARAPFVELAGRGRNRFARFAGHQHDWRHTRALAAAYERHFTKRIAADAFDFLVAPAASTEIAMLPETRAPIVYVSDTTISLLHGYYPAYMRLGEQSLRESSEIERRALHRAASIAVPSAWAAASAVEAYRAPSKRVHVVPFGANVEEPPPASDVAARVEARMARFATPAQATVKLVLVG
ncbi:MAG TPA: glycosyltransferase, partial [Gemmatimonadaceae bacterium]|nr:glycosyltransferase [Gemmatimonadaceae bacterium]